MKNELFSEEIIFDVNPQRDIESPIIFEKDLNSQTSIYVCYDYLLEGIAILNETGEIIYSNSSFQHLFRFEANPRGLNFLENLVTEDSHTSFQNYLETVFVGGRCPLMEFKLTSQNRPPFWVEAWAASKPHNNQKFLLISIRDITERKRLNLIQPILHNIANATNTAKSLTQTFSIIQQELSKIIDVTNFFIASYDSATNLISAPFYKDTFNKQTPPPQLMGKGITAYVIRNGKSLFLTPELRNRLIEQDEITDTDYRSKIWIGVPLKIENKIIGAIVIQSYDNENQYNFRDLKLIETISDQIALSIHQKQTEDKLKESLVEKQLLLKEIHHRVKNNMQVITSILNLQKPFLYKENPIKIFENCASRVNTMALIQEKVYQQENLAKINLKDFIHSLIAYLLGFYEVNSNKIALEFDFSKVNIDVNRAIPYGIIINELISNTLQHAFKDTETGVIHISFHQKKNEEILIFSDNGIGTSSALNNSTGFGFKLIEILSRQLNGKIKIFDDSGTRIELRCIC